MRLRKLLNSVLNKNERIKELTVEDERVFLRRVPCVEHLQPLKKD